MMGPGFDSWGKNKLISYRVILTRISQYYMINSASNGEFFEQKIAQVFFCCKDFYHTHRGIVCGWVRVPHPVPHIVPLPFVWATAGHVHSLKMEGFGDSQTHKLSADGRTSHTFENTMVNS